MHAFHYDYIKKECCNKAILLFPDTDSLLHKLKLKMFIMILVKVKKYLNSVFFFFLVNQNIMMVQMHQLVK